MVTPILAETTAVDIFANYFTNVNKYNHLFPQEKVYLHFDNSGYYQGEDIYFKAYVALAAGLEATPVSSVLYIELIDQYGKSIETKRLRIENGQCHGNFSIKGYYKPGFYEVRAYTKIMLNNDSEVLFSRIFPIFAHTGNGEYKPQIKEKPRSQDAPMLRNKSEKFSDLNVKFYPEGGNTVNGCLSKVAFKATDNAGLGVNATGVIISSKKDTVSLINTLHKGMGICSYLPEKGVTYTAYMNYDKKEYKFNLPKATESGYVIECNNVNKDILNVRIRKPETMVGDTLGIAVMTAGKISYANITDLKNNNNVGVSIPKSDIGPGVSTVILIDKEGKIMGERLIFNRSENMIDISVKADKETYNPFDQVNLEFNLKDKKQKPVMTTFSLTVKDSEKDISTSYYDNIYTDMLLSSEIKGYIEDVDYYFTENDVARNQALDLLMMVQGWRRYDWTKMVKGSEEKVDNFTETGIVVSGRVESVFRRKSKKGVLVKATIFPETEKKRHAECVTDENGNFNFIIADFDGKANMSIGIFDKDKQDKRLNGYIKLDRLFSPEKRALSAIEMKYTTRSSNSDRFYVLKNKEEAVKSDNYNELINYDPESRLLENITVTAENMNKRQLNSLRISSVFYDAKEEKDRLIDNGITPETYVNDFIAQINSLIPNDNVHKGRGMVYVINDRNIEQSIYQSIDEVRTDDVIRIAFCYDQISYLSYYPQMSCNGIAPIVAFIYTEQKTQPSERKGERITTLDGYAIAREFYVPDRLLPDIIEDVPYRRTLYWNPDVKTNEKGEASVSFFNNSSCKVMAVDAQTITPWGAIGVIK